jgi:hypothetical protein
MMTRLPLPVPVVVVVARQKPEQQPLAVQEERAATG